MISHEAFITMDINPKMSPNYIGDIHEMGILDNSFDTVIALQVLEYCHSPQKAMDEIYRVLKRGGIAIVSVPFIYPHHGLDNDYQRITENGLVYMSKRFSVKKIFSNGNKLMALWSLLTNGRFAHLLNIFTPLIALFNTNKKTKFAMNYIMVGKK